MKLHEFLTRIPEPFAVEVLKALPGPDRKSLLRVHKAKLPVSSGTLRRSVRTAKECKRLLAALKKTKDLDAQRTFLQGWLARRADMIVHFLSAWEIDHQNGIVEDFGWLENLTLEQVKESLAKLQEEKEDLEPIAPLVYFAYLEMPFTSEVLDVDALLAAVGAPATSA